MTDLSPREQLIRQLSPKLPRAWNLIEFERAVDTIDVITVLVRQRSVARMKEAPIGFYVTQFVLELVVPQTDMTEAEPALDQALFDLLDILDRMNPNLWESNQKVLDATTNRLAYDVTINLYTSKE